MGENLTIAIAGLAMVLINGNRKTRLDEKPISILPRLNPGLQGNV
jgi:hypothetical protein